MILEHLPVLIIVLPLLAAPLCVLLHNHLMVWTLCCVTMAASFVLSILLFNQVVELEQIYYDLGNWPAPWGIQLAVDRLNALIILIVTGAALITTFFSRKPVDKELPSDRIYLFYTAFLLNLAGLSGVTLTGDAFNLFVFIEISSLSGYALISLGKNRRALFAAFRYLILGTVGATFILIGVGLLYIMTGTLNMADLANRLNEVNQTRTVITAITFILAGSAIKLALFPMHVWLPPAYTFAPSMISIFLAATTTKVYVYVLLRYIFTIFGIDLVLELQVFNLIGLCACAGIIYGSYMAIMQSDLKMILAYSSIAQIAYMVLGLCLVTIDGLAASILHIFNHAIIKSALFMAVACYIYRLDSSKLSSLQGNLRAMPITSLALFISGLSLIGIPPTAGFISKWYLLSAALQQEHFWVVAVILTGSLLSAIYVWKILEVLYFRVEPDNESVVKIREAPVVMLVPLIILILANLYFGIDSSFSYGSALDTAKALMLSSGGYE